MTREPTSEVRRLLDQLLQAADDAGWEPSDLEVSTAGRSVYMTLARFDGVSVRVRVSDHRSRTFGVGRSKSINRPRRLGVLTFRPGTLMHAVTWLRAHSPRWPQERPSASVE